MNNNIFIYDERHPNIKEDVETMITLSNKINLEDKQGVGYCSSDILLDVEENKIEDVLHCSISEQIMFFNFDANLCLDKTEQNEKDIMCDYNKLASFIAIYLKNVNIKSNRSMNIEKVSLQLKLESIPLSIDERISKKSDVTILSNIFEDFKLNYSSKVIVNTHLLKLNIIQFILIYCPQLYDHKRNKKNQIEVIQSYFSNTKAKNKSDNYSKMLNLVKITKEIGLNHLKNEYTLIDLL